MSGSTAAAPTSTCRSSNRTTNESRVIVDLRLPMFGQHNVQNALAAIAVATEMGLSDETIRRALAGFAGVKRRFTKTGEAHGITVIDDYGHHPVEIAADAARRAAELWRLRSRDRRDAAASLHAAGRACATTSRPASATPTA